MNKVKYTTNRRYRDSEFNGVVENESYIKPKKTTLKKEKSIFQKIKNIFK